MGGGRIRNAYVDDPVEWPPVETDFTSHRTTEHCIVYSDRSLDHESHLALDLHTSGGDKCVSSEKVLRCLADLDAAY